MVLVAAFLLLSGTSNARSGPNPFSQINRTTVSVKMRGVGQRWKVSRAYLEETLTATTGYLMIENTSTQPLKVANLYAEYYDRFGRFCFSLVFSLDKNLEKKRGPLPPRTIRKLYSIGAFLAPASEPKELRLSLLEKRLAGVSGIAEDEPPMRAPITIEVRAADDSDQLSLGPEFGLAKGPVLDLVLAEVRVGISGRLETVSVAGAISESVKSWFLKWVAHQVFNTATTDGVPQTGSILLLVRAIVPREATDDTQPFLPARNSPWIVDYAAEPNETLPAFVTEIIFANPPTRVKMGGTKEWTRLPKPLFGLFEPLTGASDWCPDIFVIVPDPTSPNRFRRELTSPERTPSGAGLLNLSTFPPRF